MDARNGRWRAFVIRLSVEMPGLASKTLICDLVTCPFVASLLHGAGPSQKSLFTPETKGVGYGTL